MTERSQSGLSLKFDDATILFSRKTEFSQVELISSPEHGRVLLMDNEVQFAESDEHRYHEMLIHPIMDKTCTHARVLIIGGGDGLAAREVLKWNPVSVTIVDWDYTFMDLVAFPLLWDLNKESMNDERVQLIHMNALTFVRNTDREFDIIVIDLPDPEGPVMTQLYVDILFASQRCLANGGNVVLHIGPLSLKYASDCWDTLRLFVKTANHVFGKTKYSRFQTVHIPSFVHPWGFLYIVDNSNKSSSIERAKSVHDTSRYWNIHDDGHYLFSSGYFYIGKSRDINACVSHALPSGSYEPCECASCHQQGQPDSQ